MISPLSRFLSDEDGVIVSAELVLITTVVVIGCIAGLAALGHAVNTELVQCAESCANMSNYYPLPPADPYPGTPDPNYPTYPTGPQSPWAPGDLIGDAYTP